MQLWTPARLPLLIAIFSLAWQQFPAARAQGNDPTQPVAIPRFDAPVVDAAVVISDGLESRLNQVLNGIYNQGGPQLAVLTVPTLNGEDIASFSIRVVEDWKLGTAKADKGILLLLATDDRKVRIEVGAGLEGELTDAGSKRIIDEQIVPFLRQGDLDAGVEAGVAAILRSAAPGSAGADQLNTAPLAGERGETRAETRTGRRGAGGISGWKLLFALVLFILMISTRTGRYILLAFLFSGGRGGGGSSGRWGGGGGFSGGGGGSFSGGGASGSW